MKKWHIFEVATIASLLGMSIATLDIFLEAYRSPVKRVIIDINYYGEAYNERILLFVVITMGIIALIHKIKGGRR